MLVVSQGPVLSPFETAAVVAITSAGARTTLNWMTMQAHLAGTEGGRQACSTIFVICSVPKHELARAGSA